MIFMILFVVPEALYEPVLSCTILLVHLNKIFDLIPHTIKSLHGLYCMVFKIYAFGMTLISILHHVSIETAKKDSAYLILSHVGSTFFKYEKER